MLLAARYVLPVSASPIENGAVLVKGSAIADIGDAEALKRRHPDEEVRDFGQAALIPGLIDLHSSLEFSVMRGTILDEPYVQWVNSVIEKSAVLNSDDWYQSAVFGGLEAISNGITTVADISSGDAALRAVSDVGLRGVIYREVGAMDRRRVDHAMASAIHDVEDWTERYASERIEVGIAPAPIFVCHPSIYSKVTEYAGDRLPVAFHIAGSQEEFDFIRRGSSALSVHSNKAHRGYVEIPPWLPTGATPVNCALNWGAFDAERVMAIHCVHVTDDDIEKLVERDVSIAVCPRANAQLGMGVAPISEFLRAGLRVGFGTDSPAATDSTDLIAEMRGGMLLQRATNPRRFLESSKMLEMATIGGARALHKEDEIGSLEIGKRADVVAVDLSGSTLADNGDPTAAIVNTTSGSDVLMTMVDGKLLYEPGQWHLDFEVARHLARVIQLRAKLRS